MKRYLSFYTVSMWFAGEPIDLSSLDDTKQVSQLLSTLMFEYESEEFHIKIYRDGMILLHAPEIEKLSMNRPLSSEIMKDYWASYLKLLNCFYLLLDSFSSTLTSTFNMEITELTNRDVLLVHVDGDEITLSPNAPGSFMEARRILRQLKDLDDIPERYRNLLQIVRPLPKEVFDRTVAAFSILMQRRDIVELTSQIVKSLSEYKVANYSTSIILSWFIVESILSKKWNGYLERTNRDLPDNRKRISSRRKSTLTGRDYTISVITNILELAEEISFETFESVDTIRGYRNRIVHQDPSFTCTDEHCRQALSLALDLILEDIPIKFDLNTNYSFYL
jgi:hypothetical protein